MNGSWRIFFWAALHHPMFKYCRVTIPITLGWRWCKTYAGWEFSIKLHFSPLRAYIPYEVTDAYAIAHNQPLTFDDIPF